MYTLTMFQALNGTCQLRCQAVKLIEVLDQASHKWRFKKFQLKLIEVLDQASISGYSKHFNVLTLAHSIILWWLLELFGLGTGETSRSETALTQSGKIRAAFQHVIKFCIRTFYTVKASL